MDTATTTTRTYRLTVALAATSDGHLPFGMDEAGLDTSAFPHRIVAAFAWHEELVVDAGSVAEALEVAYREANIGGEGWAARYREGRQRSLSVGDLVMVEQDGAPVEVHQVLGMGFGRMRLADAAKVLVESPWSFDAADAAAARAA